MTVLSSKPKKQRKQHYTKALHTLQKELSMHLSKELRKNLSRRNLEARKEDTVKVMRGSEKFVGKQGKITLIKRKKRQVFIEGITRKKIDGTEIQVPFKPSNLLLVTIDEKDERRFKGKVKKKVKEDGK